MPVRGIRCATDTVEGESVEFSSLSLVSFKLNVVKCWEAIPLSMVWWELLQDASQSWTWSATLLQDSEWMFDTRKTKWAKGVVALSTDVDTSSVLPAVGSATKAHRTFLDEVLWNCGSQPPASKHSEPERQKLAAETASRVDKLEQIIANWLGMMKP